jgi:hypothetical protein
MNAANAAAEIVAAASAERAEDFGAASAFT